MSDKQIDEIHKVIPGHAIFGFFRDYRWLSNFHVCDVHYEGILYPSSEHAYQAAKSDSPNIRKTIAALPTPASAKRFGGVVLINPEDWDKQKRNVMKKILEAKFSQNPDLRQKLIETGPMTLLEETNWWKDFYWGVCNNWGENHLGFLLMELRSKLK